MRRRVPDLVPLELGPSTPQKAVAARRAHSLSPLQHQKRTPIRSKSPPADYRQEFSPLRPASKGVTKGLSLTPQPEAHRNTPPPHGPASAPGRQEEHRHRRVKGNGCLRTRSLPSLPSSCRHKARSGKRTAQKLEPRLQGGHQPNPSKVEEHSIGEGLDGDTDEAVAKKDSEANQRKSTVIPNKLLEEKYQRIADTYRKRLWNPNIKLPSVTEDNIRNCVIASFEVIFPEVGQDSQVQHTDDAERKEEGEDSPKDGGFAALADYSSLDMGQLVSLNPSLQPSTFLESEQSVTPEKRGRSDFPLLLGSLDCLGRRTPEADKLPDHWNFQSQCFADTLDQAQDSEEEDKWGDEGPGKSRLMLEKGRHRKEFALQNKTIQLGGSGSGIVWRSSWSASTRGSSVQRHQEANDDDESTIEGEDQFEPQEESGEEWHFEETEELKAQKENYKTQRKRELERDESSRQIAVAMRGKGGRRVSVVIHEQIIEPEEESGESKSFMQELAESAPKRKPRGRRMSVISVKELDGFDKVLAESVGAIDESKISKTKLHWLRVKSILETAEIVCPTTFRAHMVRYNLEPTLQSYSMVGLEIALKQFPGGADRFFGQTLPHIIARAIQITDLFEDGKYPRLKSAGNDRLDLTRQMCACLLSNLFLCALPNNDISFSALLCSQQSYQVSKVLFFLNYFDRLSGQPLTGPEGSLRFCRMHPGDEKMDWGMCSRPLMPVRIHAKGRIEEQDKKLQVDFSHREIGGGIFFRGCNHEEIRFCCYPELVTSMLVCTNIGEEEAVLISGAERFSLYQDHGFALKFAGNFVDESPRDEDGNFATTVVAIDALRFDKKIKNPNGVQLSKKTFSRELDKAYAGFMKTSLFDTEHYDCVATGPWGSGVFRGNQEVKAIVQWMAATASGRELDYYGWENLRMIEPLQDFADSLIQEEITVEMMWNACLEVSEYELQDGMILGTLRKWLLSEDGITQLVVPGIVAPEFSRSAGKLPLPT